MEDHAIPQARPADPWQEPHPEEDENPPLYDPPPSIWDQLSSGFSSLGASAREGYANASQTWAMGADSRAQLADQVSRTVGSATSKLTNIGGRRSGSVFGVPLKEMGPSIPSFLELAGQSMLQKERSRFMFRPVSEEEAATACNVAAELQMMIDEGEEVDMNDLSPISSVALVVSYLWSLPSALLPSKPMLDAVGQNNEQLTLERTAEIWGYIRENRVGIQEEEDEVLLQLLHQVLSPVNSLKQAGCEDEAHDLCLILAPAVFQLDTKGSVIHLLQLSNAEALIYTLADLV